MRKIPNQPIRAVWRWMRCLVRRSLSPEQIEIKRLRRVLHDIAASRPDQHMDIEKNPELVNWICETCHKASIGAYPSNISMVDGNGEKVQILIAGTFEGYDAGKVKFFCQKLIHIMFKKGEIIVFCSFMRHILQFPACQKSSNP